MASAANQLSNGVWAEFISCCVSTMYAAQSSKACEPSNQYKLYGGFYSGPVVGLRLLWLRSNY